LPTEARERSQGDLLCDLLPENFMTSKEDSTEAPLWFRAWHSEGKSSARCDRIMFGTSDPYLWQNRATFPPTLCTLEMGDRLVVEKFLTVSPT